MWLHVRERNARQYRLDPGKEKTRGRRARRRRGQTSILRTSSLETLKLCVRDGLQLASCGWSGLSFGLCFSVFNGDHLYDGAQCMDGGRILLIVSSRTDDSMNCNWRHVFAVGCLLVFAFLYSAVIISMTEPSAWTVVGCLSLFLPGLIR